MERLSGSAKLLRAMNTSAVLVAPAQPRPADPRRHPRADRPVQADHLRCAAQARRRRPRDGHRPHLRRPRPERGDLRDEPGRRVRRGDLGPGDDRARRSIALAIGDLAGVDPGARPRSTSTSPRRPGRRCSPARCTRCAARRTSRPTGSGTPSSACPARTTTTSDTIHHVDVPGPRPPRPRSRRCDAPLGCAGRRSTTT